MKGCLLLLAALVFATAQAKLSVQVYYEALCHDSLNFLNNQFYKTWLELRNEIDVELVPFGKASFIHNNGSTLFTCQHGPLECYANKYHACALHEYPGETSIKYIECGMGTNTPQDDGVLNNCAKKFDISFEKLKTCYSNGDGDKWLEEFGNETQAVTPKITFVPTIIFNHKYDHNLLVKSLSNFKETVCKQLDYKPDSCKA